MTNRSTAITLARVAGYHDNARLFTRLIIESRVKRETMNQAWMTGAAMFKAGVPCTCITCKPSK